MEIYQEKQKKGYRLYAWDTVMTMRIAALHDIMLEIQVTR